MSFFKTFLRYLLMAIAFALVSYFINSCEVKASSTAGNLATSYNNQGSIASFSQKEIFQGTNRAFQGSVFNFNAPGSGVMNYTINLPEGFSSGDQYNITGILYYYPGNSTAFGTTPIISINDSPCYLFNGVPLTGFVGWSEDVPFQSGGGNAGFYTFQCMAVKVPFNSSGLNGINIVNQNGGIGTRIGIWEVFNFQKFSTATEDDIVKQQEETNKKLDDLNKNQQETNDNLDDVNKNQQETNKKLDDLNGSITSDEGPSNLDSLNDTAGWLPAGPLDSVLNLPLNLLQNLNNNLSKSCEPLNLTFPFLNIPFQLPCVGSLFDKIPGFNSFYVTISTIISALILYYYFTSLYRWVDGVLSFREQHWGGF